MALIDCVLVEEDPVDSSFDFEKKGEVHHLSLSLLPFAFIKGNPPLSLENWRLDIFRN
jgi:hypothetical protein